MTYRHNSEPQHSNPTFICPSFLLGGHGEADKAMNSIASVWFPISRKMAAHNWHGPSGNLGWDLLTRVLVAGVVPDRAGLPIEMNNNLV